MAPLPIDQSEQYILPPTFYNCLKRSGYRGCLIEEKKFNSETMCLPVTVPPVKHTVSSNTSSTDLLVTSTGFGIEFGGNSSGIQGCAGAGKPLFATGTDNVPENFEPTAEFKPVEKLADVTMSSGEEDEMELFSNRAKLYHFDETVNCWKERGVGNIKILKHKNTGQARILMRRDQVLKICCNHIIVKGMKLVPRDERSFNWITLSDLSDGEPKAEKLAVKFKLSGTATAFQKVFENSLASTSSNSINSKTMSSSISVATTSMCIENLQSINSASFALSYPILTSGLDTTSSLVTSSLGSLSSSAGITLPSFNLDVYQSALSASTLPSNTSSFNLFNRYSPAAAVTSVVWSSDHPPAGVNIEIPYSSDSSSLLGKAFTAASHVVPLQPFTVSSFKHLSNKMSFPTVVTASTGLSQTSSVNSLLGQKRFKFSKSVTSFDLLSSNMSSATTTVGTNTLQMPSSSLLNLGFNFANFAVTSPSFSLFSSSPSTASSTASSTAGPSLLQTLSSGLSYAVNLPTIISSLGQAYSTTNTSLVSTSLSSLSTSLSSLFPSVTNTTSSGVFSTPAWPTTSSSENVTVSDSQPTVDDQPDMLNESQAADDGYTPLVKLTDSYEVKSGEEYEEELFRSKGKLYRYEQPTKSWKERGIGIMKILQHNSTGKIRVLMRRDQILKICCNHYITGDMELTPLANSNTSWTWVTLSDFSDEEAKVEKLCIRFKLLETAQIFKTVFTKCIEQMKEVVATTNKGSDEFSTKFAPKSSSWECDTCLIQNEEQANRCVACGSANPNMATSSTSAISSSNVTLTFGSLGSQESGGVLSSSGGFKLPGWLPSLSQPITQLPADTGRPSGFKPSVDTSSSSNTITVDVEADDSSFTDTEFATRFALKVDKWECSYCFVSNEKYVGQCVACGNANPSIKVAAASITSAASTFSMPSFSGITLPPLPPIVSTANPTGGLAASYSTSDLLLGQNMSASSTPSSSFNFFNSLTTTASTDLLQKPSSSLSYQVNFSTIFTSLGQSSSATNTKPVSTSLSSLFQQFPTHTTSSSGVFSTPAWPTTTSSENVTVSDSQPINGDQLDMLNESQAADDGYTPLVKLTDSYEVAVTSAPSTASNSAMPPPFDLSLLPSTTRKFPTQDTARSDSSEDCIIRVDQGSRNLLSLPQRFKLHGGLPSFSQSISQPSAEKNTVQPSVFKYSETLLPKTDTAPLSCFKLSTSLSLNQPDSLPSVDKAESSPKVSNWECSNCCSSNKKKVAQCVACGKVNPNIKVVVTSTTSTASISAIPNPSTTRKFPREPHRTSSDIVTSTVSYTVSLPVATVASAPKPMFVFGGSNQCSQSSLQFIAKPISVSGSSQKFTFGTGTFEFNSSMKVDRKSFPSCGGNTSISGLSQPKDTDNIEKDFQAIPSHKENPFYVDGRPVEYSISSVAMGDSAASSTIYSAVHSGSGVPPSLISISDSQQMDRGSDDKDSDSMLSIPSLETSSAVPSLETASVAPSSLFGQSRMPKWEPKILFPTEGASVGPGAGGLDSIHADNTEGEPHPEAEANIYFDPVVSLPSSFDATSGEENEDCLFTYKAKLFRYDGSLKVWKDRGIGVIKILKNKTSGKGRVLMRREQILKLCCNHYIVPGMTLRPGSYADRSWVWFTSADLSEDTPQEETLCVKFKYAETASEFKKTFDMFAAPDYAGTSVSQNSVSPRPTPIPVQDSDVLFVGEELPEPELVQLAEQYMLPPTFYNYLKKPPCTGCIGCLEEEEVKSSVNNVVLPGVTIPQVKHNVDLFSSSIDTVSFADLAAANTTGFGGGFGGSGFGSKQGFTGAGKPPFATQTDKDENDAPETFESTAEFKPVVKLSSDFTMSSGEEDEMELFSNRAKLYRYDETINQWKERGVGNIKILRHKNTGRVRILMRRDQVLKICCNHIIVKGMKLVPRDEKSFNWITLSDLADGEPKVEKLAVKFKLTDTATTFQKVFDNSLASGIDDGEGSLNTEASSTIANVTKNANTWECQACYIPNEESINKCIACGGDHQPTTSSGTCSITLSSGLASISMPVTTTPPVSTSSSIMISTVSSTTSLPVTTVVSAPPKPIFVFGGNNQSSQSSQSSATSGSGFSLSPPKFAFGSGTFEFSSPMKVDMKSFPSWGGNTSISGLSQPKDTDNIEKDFQAIPSHKENPFYVDGRPVEYSISSVAMGDSAASSTIYSAVHSGSDVPPSLISISNSQQMDRGSDKKDHSMLSIPSLETSSGVPSLETTSTAPSSLFGQSRMPKWEPKILFPTEGASVGPGAGGLDSIHANNTEGEPHPAAEANIYFDPVVSLPSSFDATSGEENEDCLFTYKAKLFRYDGSLKVWKDRGIGVIKILKNKTSGKGRVLMRREQILKLCCNHYIVPGMTLRPGSYADRSWVWFTSADLSEDTPQEETLCVKFKYAEAASEFKSQLCQVLLPYQLPLLLVLHPNQYLYLVATTNQANQVLLLVLGFHFLHQSLHLVQALLSSILLFKLT